jgi:hypothetical protein
MNHHVSTENSVGGIESRLCSLCESEMVLVRVTPARLGFNSQAFECVQCGHVDKVIAGADPLQSDVLGWLLGELRPPN